MNPALFATREAGRSGGGSVLADQFKLDARGWADRLRSRAGTLTVAAQTGLMPSNPLARRLGRVVASGGDAAPNWYRPIAAATYSVDGAMERFGDLGLSEADRSTVYSALWMRQQAGALDRISPVAAQGTTGKVLDPDVLDVMRQARSPEGLAALRAQVEGFRAQREIRGRELRGLMPGTFPIGGEKPSLMESRPFEFPPVGQELVDALLAKRPVTAQDIDPAELRRATTLGLSVVPSRSGFAVPIGEAVKAYQAATSAGVSASRDAEAIQESEAAPMSGPEHRELAARSADRKVKRGFTLPLELLATAADPSLYESTFQALRKEREAEKGRKTTYREDRELREQVARVAAEVGATAPAAAGILAGYGTLGEQGTKLLHTMDFASQVPLQTARGVYEAVSPKSTPEERVGGLLMTGLGFGIGTGAGRALIGKGLEGVARKAGFGHYLDRASEQLAKSEARSVVRDLAVDDQRLAPFSEQYDPQVDAAVQSAAGIPAEKQQTGLGQVIADAWHEQTAAEHLVQKADDPKVPGVVDVMRKYGIDADELDPYGDHYDPKADLEVQRAFGVQPDDFREGYGNKLLGDQWDAIETALYEDTNRDTALDWKRELYDQIRGAEKSSAGGRRGAYDLASGDEFVKYYRRKDGTFTPDLRTQLGMSADNPFEPHQWQSFLDFVENHPTNDNVLIVPGASHRDRVTANKLGTFRGKKIYGSRNVPDQALTPYEFVTRDGDFYSGAKIPSYLLRDYAKELKGQLEWTPEASLRVANELGVTTDELERIFNDAKRGADERAGSGPVGEGLAAGEGPAASGTEFDPYADPVADTGEFSSIVRDRSTFQRGLSEHTSLDPEQVDAILRITDARAKGHVADFGGTVDDWYRTRIQGVTKAGANVDPADAAQAGGAVEFLRDGRAVIHAFSAGDVSTIAHEVGHIFRRDLGGDLLAKLEKHYGIEGGVWHEAAEEAFARGFERYLAEGKGPEGLGDVFARFKAWLGRIYGAITGSEIDVPMVPAVRDTFDRLLSEEGLAPKKPTQMPTGRGRVVPGDPGEAVMIGGNPTRVYGEDAATYRGLLAKYRAERARLTKELDLARTPFQMEKVNLEIDQLKAEFERRKGDLVQRETERRVHEMQLQDNPFFTDPRSPGYREADTELMFQAKPQFRFKGSAADFAKKWMDKAPGKNEPEWYGYGAMPGRAIDALDDALGTELRRDLYLNVHNKDVFHMFRAHGEGGPKVYHGPIDPNWLERVPEILADAKYSRVVRESPANELVELSTEGGEAVLLRVRRNFAEVAGTYPVEPGTRPLGAKEIPASKSTSETRSASRPEDIVGDVAGEGKGQVLSADRASMYSAEASSSEIASKSGSDADMGTSSRQTPSTRRTQNPGDNTSTIDRSGNPRASTEPTSEGTSDGPDVLFQRRPLEGFVLKSAQVARERIRGPIEPAAAKAALENGGVKPDEMKWTGLDDWLAEHKGPVDPDELQQFLASNQLGLQEVAKDSSRYRAVLAARQAVQDAEGPDARAAAEAALQDAELEWRGSTENAVYPDKASKDGSGYREFYVVAPGVDGYRGGHWGEPNVVAHLRTTDREIDGRPTLFVEEVQSDWHQAARSVGYVDKEKPWVVFDPKDGSAEAKFGSEADAVKYLDDQGRRASRQLGDYDYTLQPTFSTNAVPEGPFSKTWPELMFKRALRLAAEEGREQLAWTSGRTQGQRYGLLDDSGMRGFYDQILPKQVDKYLKKWGVKSELRVVDGEAMHVVPVTEAMRKSVLEDGQLLFQKKAIGKAGDLNEPAPKVPVTQRAREIADGMKLTMEKLAVGVGGTPIDQLRNAGKPGSFAREAGRQLAVDTEKILNLSASHGARLQDGLAKAIEESFGKGAKILPAKRDAVNEIARMAFRGEFDAFTPEQRRVWDAWSATNKALVDEANDVGVWVDDYVNDRVAPGVVGKRIAWYDRNSERREMWGRVISIEETADESGRRRVSGMTVESDGGQQYQLDPWTPFSRQTLVASDKFFPRVLKPEVIKQLANGEGKDYDHLIDLVRQQTDAKSAAEAEQVVRQVLDPVREERAVTGGAVRLERARIPWTFPEEFYNLDFQDVTQHHVQRAVQRLVVAKVWGHDGSRFQWLMQKIPTEMKGMAEQVRWALGEKTGLTEADRISRTAVSIEGTWQVLSKLTGLTTAIKQITQTGSTFGVFGGMSYAKGLGSSLGALAKEIRGEASILRDVRLSGAVDHAVLAQSAIEDYSDVGRALTEWGLTVSGVKPMDNLLRYHAAITAKFAGEEALRRLKVGIDGHFKPDANYRLLSDFFMFGDDELRRMRADGLTDDDASRMYAAGGKTQIRGRAADLPQWFGKDPYLRVATRFQQFNYGQSRLIVWAANEAAKGNPVPLARMVAAYAALGALTNPAVEKVRAWMTGKEERESPDNLGEYIFFHTMKSGAFGLFGRPGEVYADLQARDPEGEVEPGTYGRALQSAVTQVPIVSDLLGNTAAAVQYAKKTGGGPAAALDEWLRKSIVLYGRLAQRGDPDVVGAHQKRKELRSALEKAGYEGGAISYILDSVVPVPAERGSTEDYRAWRARYESLVEQGYSPYEARMEAGPRPKQFAGLPDKPEPAAAPSESADEVIDRIREGGPQGVSNYLRAVGARG